MFIIIIIVYNCYNCFLLKYDFSIHTIAFFSGNVILSESGEKSTVYKWKQILMWEDNKGWTFSLEEEYYGLWTHILAGSSGLKLKHINDGFVSYKHAAFHFTRC